MRIVIKTILSIALALGLLVGFAHWQLAKQTPDGVWEFDTEGVEGSIHVGGDTVLISDSIGGDGWVAVDLRTGERLAGEQQVSVHEARLGHNGWFAIRSGDVRDRTLTVYDDSGKQVWTHRQGATAGSRVVSLVDDTAVVATADDSGQALIKIDARGSVVWQRPLTDESAWVMHLGTDHPDEEVGEYVTTPEVAALKGPEGVRLLDAAGQPVGPAGEEKRTVVVGDRLVTATVADGECRFRAWTLAGEAWSSSTPCPGATRPPFLSRTIGDLMLVDADSETGWLAVDVDDGKVAPAPYGGQHRFNPKTLESTSLSDEVAVEQHKSEFTAWDPETGEEVWQLEGPAPTAGLLDASKKNRYPGLSVSGDVVSILSNSKPWWRLFAWGATVPRSTTTLLDGDDGEEFTTYRSADLYSMTATDDDSILLLSDGVLRLLER